MAENTTSENLGAAPRIEDPIEQEARNIMGSSFLGVEVVEKTFDMKLGPDDVPKIPFSRERLEKARQQHQFLILRIGKAQDGEGMTMRKIEALVGNKFMMRGMGGVLRSSKDMQDESFFNDEKVRSSWALVSINALPNPTMHQNYLQQTEALAAYLKSTFGEQMPAAYTDAILEFGEQKENIARILTSDWQEAGRKLSGLKINQLARQNAAEILYDETVYRAHFQREGIVWLQDNCALTNSRSSVGSCVAAGDSRGGVRVYTVRPDNSLPFVHTYVSLMH